MTVARIAIALDVPGMEPALRLADELGEGPDLYKVGLELYTREGPKVIRELHARGSRVFLDLKLHDIPATVAAAVSAAAEHGVELLTVHTAGGAAMLRAAVEAAGDDVELLGITVLTSLPADELADTWGRDRIDVGDEVLRLGALAVEAGVHGLVASAREASTLRRTLGSRVTLVTPGIRLAGGDRHDQARIATPAEAVRAGADLLVVGRAVTAAADPRAALERVRAEMDGVVVADAPAGGGA
ncbi:MAG: orotidine-5'-phosphate decarboxylase [Longimicrobiales bacterium]